LMVFSPLSMLEEMLCPSATESPKHSGCERIFAKVYFFIPAVEVLEPQADNKRRRSAIAGTTDCAQAFHHAFDSRPRCRVHSMALYPVPRTFPVAVRFRQ